MRQNKIYFHNFRFLIFLFYSFYCPVILAQKKLSINCIDDKKINKQLQKTTSLSVTLDQARLRGKQCVVALHKKGYLLARIDTILESNEQIIVNVQAGNLFKWGNLKLGKSSKEILVETGLSKAIQSNSYFKPNEYAAIQNKIIEWCENNGHPFASIYLDSIIVQRDTINAVLIVNLNKKISIDSLVINGNSGIKKKFLENYLEIKQGNFYSEKKIKVIGTKLKQLPYIKEMKPTAFYMDDINNKIIFYLDKKNSSQFDGIIGILPTDGGKTIFTGDVKIKLQNLLLKSGENLEINWRRLMTQTQDLKAKIAYPFLFRSKLGGEYAIKLYKRDSLFIDVHQNFALNYLFNGLNSIKAIFKNRNSSILSVSGLESLSVLPEYADVKVQSYGLGFSFEQLDYRFNPKSGISINQQAVIGNRTIKKNSAIKESLYNNLTLKSTQYQLELDLSSYSKLGKKSCLKNAIQFGSIGGNKIFKNELFRIGGNKSIRGFDEESIFCSTYVIYTLEYRFLFEENSNLFLFSDWAWYENTSGPKSINDWPKSFGTGINFETKSGILSLAYALGSQFNNRIDLRTGKIHFGLVSLF